jgi:regulator of replication initiation timing
MISVFGYDVGIENGATALGNQTVEQLKAGEELKQNLNSQLDNLNQQVEFTQGHVDFLDKEVDEKSAEVERLDSEQSALENTIQSDKNELDKIAKKKADVKAVENMEVKHTMFGGKVTLAEDDFNNLQTLAQKQIVSAKSTKKLKSRVSELEQTNSELVAKVEDLTVKSGKSIKLQIENDKLKQRVSLLDKILEFIDRLGLREKLDLFLKSQERENSRKREQEL